MQTIKIKSMHIENFMGCKLLDVNFFDKTMICCQNAGGKTTIIHAFSWLLFNKNAFGEEKFSVRPLDKQSHLIHDIVIAVEAVVNVNGNDIVLRKEQKEKWSRQNGSTTKQLKGNDNIFYIDGAKTRASEFKAFIEDSIQETVFRLVTNPNVFSSMPWKEQRKILLSLISDITDADVIDSNSDFEPLREKLSKYPVDHWLTILNDQLKDSKKKMDEIPSRIDEVSKNIENIDFSELEKKKSDIESELYAVAAEKAETIVAAKENSNKDQILKLNSQINKMENDAMSERSAKESELKNAIFSSQSYYQEKYSEFLRLERSVAFLQDDITHNQTLLRQHTEEWRKVKNTLFDESRTICPMCNQQLPEEKANELRNSFEEKKKLSIDSIIAKGNECRKEIDCTKDKLNINLAGKEKLQQELDSAKNAVQSAKEAYDQYCSSAKSIKDDPKYVQMKEELDQLIDIENSHLKNDIAPIEREYNDRVSKLNYELTLVNNALYKKTVIQNAKTRVDELRSALKEAAQKMATCERDLDLLKSFTKTKLNLLSQKINAEFSVVNFKLFDYQMNGGYKETCECLVNGVPYQCINSAARVIAGVDIITTLMRAYDVQTPVFIDNAEGINTFNIPRTDFQMILLTVSDDKEIFVKEFKN